MLHHRLAFEAQTVKGVSAGAAYTIDQMPRIQTPVVATGMLLLDLASCIGACFLTGRGSVMSSHGVTVAMLAWLAMPIMLWLASAYATALYDQAALRTGSLQLLPALAATCLAFGPSLGAQEFGGPSGAALSPAWTAFLCQMVIATSLRGGWGLMLRALLRRGYCLEKVVLLSSSLSASRVLCATLERRTKGKLRGAICAVTPHPADEAALQWLESVTSSHGIDRIVLVDDGGTSFPLHETMVGLARTSADITIVSEGGAAYRLGGQPSNLPRLDERAPPMGRWQLVGKRVFDICVAAMAMLCLSPLLLLLAALIRLDSKGPALFRQTREGLDGRPFQILKFRTMYVHMADSDCARQTSRGDARVTRIGRLLRTTSLDELPQLVNVLRGDMSVIGPRPHALGMSVDGKSVARAINGYEARFRVKPGITGWAQINGSRGEISAAKALRQRVALDCHYIENWSLKMDALILCRTVALVFRDELAF